MSLIFEDGERWSCSEKELQELDPVQAMDLGGSGRSGDVCLEDVEILRSKIWRFCCFGARTISCNESCIVSDGSW